MTLYHSPAARVLASLTNEWLRHGLASLEYPPTPYGPRFDPGVRFRIRILRERTFNKGPPTHRKSEKKIEEKNNINVAVISGIEQIRANEQ